MAEYDLTKLYDKYEGFHYPYARVYLGGQDPEQDGKLGARIYDYSVEITSDFKASIASFSIGGMFNDTAGLFNMSKLKKYIYLGNDVKIFMGHASSIMEVFRGYIARVDFSYNPDTSAEGVIRITAMDVKGIMMSNNSHKRLSANYYSDAVSEIFNGAVYQNLINRQIITDLSVSDTPDKPPGGAGPEPPDNRIELVAESDYDFVVKAAKKFNYEFFTVGGNIAFRKAKSNTQELIEIIPSTVIKSFDIGYDITGVVGSVKVRTLDIGKANKIEVQKKNSAKFSLGSKAKPMIANQVYVYTDSSIETQADADLRASYLLESMSYRLGSLNMKIDGIPEIVPGRFVVLKDFGDGVSNKYYVTDVIHEFYENGEYTTTIVGKAATL
ncbi:MAG: hypothetical protein K6G12_02535 [Lachnospiraceae bacterium]|nr:hypothetical protein [Lachnospiraceae bacterium]